MNPQAIMDGLVAGSMIGLGAVGITLTYSILRFANFAHGDFISWGAYFALAVAGALGAAFSGLLTPIGPFSFGWALPIAALVAVAFNGGLALLVDTLLFKRLRARNCRLAKETPAPSSATSTTSPASSNGLRDRFHCSQVNGGSVPT